MQIQPADFFPCFPTQTRLTKANIDLYIVYRVPLLPPIPPCHALGFLSLLFFFYSCRLLYTVSVVISPFSAIYFLPHTLSVFSFTYCILMVCSAFILFYYSFFRFVPVLLNFLAFLLLLLRLLLLLFLLLLLLHSGS